MSETKSIESETPAAVAGAARGSAEILWRIQNYLALGGLWNPEAMDHDKVRELIMDCQKHINRSNAIMAELIAASVAHDYAMTDEIKEVAGSRVVNARNAARAMLPPNSKLCDRESQ